MAEFNIGQAVLGIPLREGIIAVGILLVSIIAMWAAHLILNRIAKGLTQRQRNQFGVRLINAISRPILLLVFIQGLIVATTVISVLDPFRNQLRSMWSVAVIALLALTLVRSMRESLTWYARYVAPRDKSGPLDSRLVGPLRRFLTLTIYALAGMLILDQLDISISPLIAGLGIGGLAVALALQPTLSNLFAGTYLVSDKVISPGDFIELENGLTGYISEIGWRSTRIRTPFNNMVIIPNSRLADSILTNYYGPSMEIGVIVECGVSYSSDMSNVEALALEAAKEVVTDLPEGLDSADPWFGYSKFGESNIDFWVWVTAKDRLSSFKLKSELMKRLHQKFNEHHIEINYPVRKLIQEVGGATKSL
jgi:small-conductance mechanosensitive channel